MAALALLTSLLGHGRVAVETISEHWSGTNFDLNASVVELGRDTSTFAVSNVSNRNAVVTSVQCGLYLPIDPEALFEKTFTEQGQEQLQWGETAGMFLVSLDPDDPIFVPAGEQALITFTTRHISPAFGADRFSAERKADDLVSSYCIVSGVRGNNEQVGGIVLLSLSNIRDLDALDLLQNADYSESQEPEREALIGRIRNVRSEIE